MTYLPNSGRVNVTIGGNTTGVGSLVSTGTATLVGGNNITLSQNGNAITISGGAGGGAFSAGMSTIGNTLGTSGMATNQLVLAGGNNVTLSQVTGAGGNTLTISAASQTNQTIGFYGAGNTTQNSTTTLDARSLTFNGLGGVSVGYSNGSVQISGATGGGGVVLAGGGTTYTSGTANLSVAGGAMTIASSTGPGSQSFNFSVPQTSSLAATGAMSIATGGSTISIGVPAFSAGVSNIGNTLGSTGSASNQVIFAGGNNITLSQVTGAGGNTVTIQGVGGATLSRFEYPEGLFNPLANIGQGSLSINHIYVPFNVTGSAMKIGGSLSASTNTSATTASVNMSLWMGIYGLTGSTISRLSSGSANNGFQWSQSASTTANTSVNSMRQMTVPMNVNMTPGEYWIAAVVSSATTYANAGFTMYGNNQITSGATGAVLTPIGSNTSANRDAMLFQGIYTAATAAGPATIVGSQINNTSAGYVQQANFYNVIFNATY